MANLGRYVGTTERDPIHNPIRRTQPIERERINPSRREEPVLPQKEKEAEKVGK